MKDFLWNEITLEATSRIFFTVSFYEFVYLLQSKKTKQ